MVYSWVTTLLMAEWPFFSPPFVGAILPGPNWKQRTLGIVSFVYLMTAILTGMRWNLNVSFPWWVRILKISSCVYWPLAWLLLKTVKLICSFLNWAIYFGIYFSELYILWILILCWMNSLQRFSLIL
jgi:hypothetical protein